MVRRSSVLSPEEEDLNVSAKFVSSPPLAMHLYVLAPNSYGADPKYRMLVQRGAAVAIAIRCGIMTMMNFCIVDASSAAVTTRLRCA